MRTTFLAFAADPAATELDAALLVNQLLVSDLDCAGVRARLEAMGFACDRPEAPWSFLAANGFNAATLDPDPIEGSRLDLVLERRRGIPISLAVVLIEVARASGLPAVGINFPGHFLVRAGDTLVDPLGMNRTDEEIWQQRAGVGPAAFSVATPVMVLQRMLNNIKAHHVRHGRWDLALDVLDCQRAVSPSEIMLAVERSEYWLRLGAKEMVRSSLEEALELCGPSQQELAVELDRRLRRLTRGGEISH